jgi:hypothetical protein
MFTLSRVTLLLLAIPSLLMSMEQDQQYEIPQSHFSIVLNPLSAPVKNETETLYTNASDLLNSFKRTEEISLKKLITFMNNVQNFTKRTALDEHYLGSLVFTKEPTVKASFGFQVSPCHVALFFKKLQQYHTILADCQKVTPTIEDLRSHYFNQNLQVKQAEALEIAITFGLHIDTNKINYNLPPFHSIAQNVATEEFTRLCNETEILIKCKKETAKLLTDLIFLNLTGFVQAPEINSSSTDYQG